MSSATHNRFMQMDPRDMDVLRTYAEKIIESGQLGKSELYPKLLRYLAEASRRGEPPKEIEIALDVFGKGDSFNVHEDSIVRVYVHSLRAKLDEYYRDAGRLDAIRIEIPKGGYKVVGVPQDEAVEIVDPVGTPPRRPRQIGRWVYGLGGMLLAASVLGNVYFATRQDAGRSVPANEVARTFAWAGLLKDHRPIAIVLGDLFFYTEFDPELGRQRYIGDVPVNSREALRTFLKKHPDRASRLGSVDTTLLTKGTAYGLAAVMPILEGRHRTIKPTILDELDISDVRDDDVIFIGPLHRLGPIGAYYDALSRYKYDRENNRLIDKKTGKVFAARGPMSRNGVDYGMFAEFRGPDGNRILIFSSVASDIGLLQIVRSMTSKTELDHIKSMLKAQGAGATDSFEALFSATGYDRTDLTAKIVEVHPLKQPRADDNADGL